MDYAIFALIAIAAVYGGFKGVIGQFVGLFSIIIGIWAAFKFCGILAPVVSEWTGAAIEIKSLKVILFVVLLISAILIGKLVARLLEGLVQLSMLGWFNKLLGVVFGALKAIIAMSILLYLIDNINDTWHIIPNETLQSSKGIALLRKFYTEAFPYLRRLF